MSGRRAHSVPERQRVRQAFIDAGRRILVREGGRATTMRRIAAEAGYSAGLIYQYFSDHRTLLVAIREFDMNAATDAMEAGARSTTDPARRVREVFLVAARYWLDHPDHFDVLFAGSRERLPLHTPDGVPFGRSASVMRSLALYAGVVDDFLASLPCRPIDTTLAMDTLIATTHGVIAFPRATPSMPWSATAAMVDTAVSALVGHWICEAKTASEGKHRTITERV